MANGLKGNERGPQAGEQVRIGVETGSRDADRIRANTAKAVRQLMIFVGGTGLEALESLAVIFRRNNMRFGDETQGGKQPIIPHAIFVDTDLTATKQATEGIGTQQEEDEEAEDQRRKLQLVDSLKGLGVNICNLVVNGQEQMLVQTGLAPLLTPGRPSKEDPRGSKADPRIGELKYLTVRGLDDERNPRHIARSIVRSWLQTGNAFLDEQTFLTVVGGLHGGTGQVALPLMADVRGDIEDLLRGSKTSVTTERYSMTSESAGIDRKRRQDGKQTKRMLNTAVGVIRANAADVQGGIEVSPGEWVPGIPAEYDFIVGGSTPYRMVAEDGGHYVPTQVIAKALAIRLLGADLTATGRSNAEFDRRGDSQSSGLDMPNTPRAVFSVLGVSEAISDPDRASLTAEKRRVIFDEALGVTHVNNAAADERKAIVFPDTLLNSLLESVGYPEMLASQFGEGLEARLNAENERDRFMAKIRTELAPAIAQALFDHRQEKDRHIRESTQALRNTEGLATALRFLRGALTQLQSLAETVQDKLERDCSPESQRALSEQVEESLRRVQGTNIFPFNLWIFRFKDDDSQKLSRRVTALAQALTRNAASVKDRNYLLNFSDRVLNPLLETVMTLQAELSQEYRIASARFDAIAPNPREMGNPTPFDLPIVAELEVDRADAPRLRSDVLGEGAWTAETMGRLHDSVRVTAQEIGLQSRLDGPTVEALDKLSHPLVRPRTLAGTGFSMSENHVATVPAATDIQMQTVLVPPKATKKRVRPEAPMVVMTEEYGVNSLLEDAYVRFCVETFLGVPPTLRQAEALEQASPNNETRKRLNRESQFTFKGQMERMLPAVFEALALRKQQEAGGRGEVRTCSAEDCGVKFHRSKAEVRANIGLCCPGCRQIPGNESRAQQRVAEAATATARGRDARAV